MNSTNNEKAKVALVSLGCPKNQVDAENMLLLIEDAGYRLTTEPAEAEAIIINTCGFIQSAKEEAIAAILDAAEYKESGVTKKLLVTGCLAQRYADQIEQDLPEVDAILGTSHYYKIADALDNLFQTKDQSNKSSVLNMTEPLHGERLAHMRVHRQASNPYYAYLKISEGCRHNCAYCAIPGIRGDMISRPFTEIIEEAGLLLKSGIKELIIVAQDTTSYGLDIYGERRFAELLKALAELGTPRLRFLYAYADGMTDDVLEVMAEYANIAHYIDLPIQHAADAVLKRMYRSDRQARLRAAFARIREFLPDVTLRTTVMVGFPGETEEDFEELLRFIQEIRFDHLGCFIFSPEEGTAAADMPDQVPAEISQARFDALMLLQQGIHESKIKAKLGETAEVLIEGVADDGLFYLGRSAAEAPEIDSVSYVLFEKGEPQVGEIYPVRYLEVQAYDLIGVCEHEFTE